MPVSAKVQTEMIADELSLYRYANTVVTVSDKERLYFATTTVPDVKVLGHTIEKVQKPSKCFHDRFGFLFVGAIQSDDSPNGDSLIWFLKEVWPLIEKLKMPVWILLACVIPALSKRLLLQM